jgi:spore germination cell wall hydrolase CwlJ-like protein
MKQLFIFSLTLLLFLTFSTASKKYVAAPLTLTATVSTKEREVSALVASLHDSIIRSIHNDKHKKEITCLAKNVFYEARNQPIMGKISVAYVPVTRSKNANVNVCKVIRQKSSHGCQFSWTCTKTKHKSNVIEDKAWNEALIVAYLVHHNKIEDPTMGATFYYNPKKAHPTWAKTKTIVKTLYTNAGYIGDHIFLRD